MNRPATATPAGRIPRPPARFPSPLQRAWIQRYCHGDCHQMTAALTEALTRPEAVVYELAGEGRIHSAVRLAGGRALDASGFVTLATQRRRYGLPALTRRVVAAPTTRGDCLDDEEMVLALEVAARLDTLPAAVRATAWRHRWTRYADVEAPDDPLEGPAAAFDDDASSDRRYYVRPE